MWDLTKSLDEALLQRVIQVMDRARRSGANVPSRLNEAGLLWTPEREHQAQTRALREMLDQFRAWMPHEFLRTINRELVNCTPTDMHTAIRLWLENYHDHMKKGA